MAVALEPIKTVGVGTVAVPVEMALHVATPRAMVAHVATPRVMARLVVTPPATVGPEKAVHAMEHRERAALVTEQHKGTVPEMEDRVKVVRAMEPPAMVALVTASRIKPSNRLSHSSGKLRHCSRAWP
jgi:hypothetical protein